jgi:hypothetical protein
MKLYPYFLDNNLFPMYFAINLALIYLFFMIGGLFSLHIFFYIGIGAIASLVYLFFKSRQIYFQQKSNLEKEIDIQDYNAFKKELLDKYTRTSLNFGEIDLKEQYLKPFFNKFEYTKDLIENRFNESSLFRERLSGLLQNALSAYIKNIDVLDGMQKANKMSKDDTYSSDIQKCIADNELISHNVDDLVKQFLMEEKEKNSEQELNDDFKRNISLFERIKEDRL